MTELVRTEEIEGLVGARRHSIKHVGRAVTAEERVYILHSQACKDNEIDLRDCPFSKALDWGINLSDWEGYMDRATVLAVSSDGALLPAPIDPSEPVVYLNPEGER